MDDVFQYKCDNGDEIQNADENIFYTGCTDPSANDDGTAHVSSSVLYKLAEGDRSQKVPVNWKPVLVQKIIHPTPHKSTAFFRSYDPSVVHIRDPLRRPLTIHDTSSGVSLAGLITSHIHVPPPTM